jgi:hypothetical protein
MLRLSTGDLEMTCQCLGPGGVAIYLSSSRRSSDDHGHSFSFLLIALSTDSYDHRSSPVITSVSHMALVHASVCVTFYRSA